MPRVIVGTAGHVDHGKTRLVEAITGIDCDRWAEERERGITIDLGFAHLTRGDLQLGFIDVPGHERFLHNALAGLGGIRIVLLVVAADEGVKPQTLEHLEICSLLAIPRAVVALTKTDLVNEDLLELAQLEVEELLSASPWPQAEILPVSSVSGEGLSELVDTLVRHAVDLPEEEAHVHPVRLPIDRAFQFRGLGSIVTGTLVAGRVRAGDALALMPSGPTGRVRSLQVHGEERQEARAGERTAVQLSGIALADLERGQQLVEPESLRPSSSLLVRVDLLPGSPTELAGSTPIRFHLYSSEVVGRLRPLGRQTIEPGQTSVAELKLAAPVVAVRDDRFIIRRPSPPTTLGGGYVLDPWWQRRRGKRLRAAVEALSGDLADCIVLWANETGFQGITADDLARRLGVAESGATRRLTRLADEGRLLLMDTGHGRPGRWVDAERIDSLGAEMRQLLEDYLKRERLAPGMPRAEAVRKLMPGVPAELTRRYLELLEEREVLRQRGDLLTLPGREASLTSEESDLAKGLTKLYEEAGLTPPPPSEAARLTASKPQIVEGVIHYLIQQGRLVKIGGGLVISRAAIDRLERELLDSGLDEFTVAQFRDHFGMTRKWAIPILEYLDSQRVTHRLGDIRRVSMPSGGSR